MVQKLETQNRDKKNEIDNLKQRLSDMENEELNMSQLMDEVEKETECSEDIIPPTQADTIKAATDKDEENSAT